MKKIYGLIGYPVKHSLSPRMHNAAFRHLGIDAEYKLFEVKPEKLKDFFDNFRKKGLAGINITIPHKTKSMFFMDDLTDEAKLIEAINTVVLKADHLIGHNTDGIGFIKSLKEDLDFNPKGKVAFIFGAGGASRAVSFSLAQESLSRIILTDIDADRAASLARDIEKKTGIEVIAVDHDKKAIKELVINSDLLVNATPIGMKPGEASVVPKEFLHKGLVVFDLIYNPKQPPLLKEADKLGLRNTNGLGMLLHQGAAAFKFWTAKNAPVEIMRGAIEC